MPRPFKNRRISGPPGSLTYKPAGVPAEKLEKVVITLDEYEAISLLDYHGMDQESAAGKMGVSRPTVTRIYSSGRKKIAEALVEGKAICIEGGPVSQGQPSKCCPKSAAGMQGLKCGRNRRRRGMCPLNDNVTGKTEKDNSPSGE